MSKISSMSAPDPLSGLELIPILQGGGSGSNRGLPLLAQANVPRGTVLMLRVPMIADLSATADADPGAAKVRWNNADPHSATIIYIDDVDGDSGDVAAALASLTLGGYIYLQASATSVRRGTWQKWQVSTNTDASGYTKIGATLIAHAGTFVDAEALEMTIQQPEATTSADVAGPASSTDGHVALFDGTDGKKIKDGGALGAMATESDAPNDGQEYVRKNEAWAVKTSGMSNPMTTAGDLIVATAGGSPSRLAIGADTYVLTVVSGNIAWAASGGGGGGMTNPMTTPGDLIVGGTAGAPTRLAKGTNGYVLKMVSGSIAWAADVTGLTRFTEGLNTSSPNSASYPYVYLNATNSATNIDAAIVPKGTGAFSLAVANGAASGGDKRGYHAVDLQLYRSSSDQVASGESAFVVGYGNTASGFVSTALGSGNVVSGTYASGLGYGHDVSGTYATALGRMNTVSGESAIALGGFYNTADGNNSACIGSYASTGGMTGAFSQGCTSSAYTVASAQRMSLVGYAITTSAASTVMVFDVYSPSAYNQLMLPTNSAIRAKAQVIGYDAANDAAVVFDADFLIKNTGGTIAIVGTPAVTQAFSDASLTSCTLTIGTDATYKTAKFTVKGLASKTIRWTLSIYDAVQVLG